MGIFEITRSYRNYMRLAEIGVVLTRHGFGDLFERINLYRYVPFLDRLIGSIELVGVIHSILVTPDLLLICGRRRLEACRALDWKTIPGIRVDVTPDELREIELAEGLHERPRRET